jgi:hypothetical protein
VTLTELEQFLPNGLHDAELIALRMDYVRGEAEPEPRANSEQRTANSEQRVELC